MQTFYVGPASCGVPGTAAGLEQALARFGSVPLAELVRPGVRLAREGAPVNAEQAYILDILAPIHDRLAGTRELYAPEGRTLREGERSASRSWPRRWSASAPRAPSRSTAARSRRR